MDNKEKRTLWIYYLLAIYIFCQIIWWGYSLLDANFKLREATARLGDTITDESKNAEWMVFGEGLVFLAIFLFGVWKIQNNLKKEFRHARIEKTFLLSVTHELKTPVAILRLILETLKKKKEMDPVKQTEILDGALQETERLENLVENILFAARLDQPSSSFIFNRLDLSSLVSNVSNRFTKLVGPSRLVLNIQPGITMEGDEPSLQILLANLIDNAIKYSPLSGKIRIELNMEPGTVTLLVADEGPGIPVEERKRVLQKFYRIGNEETRKTRGTGLGLYLVTHIARLHNGNVQITDNYPNGTIMSVKFQLSGAIQ